MTPSQFKALKTGDLVRGGFSGFAFVVTQNHGDRVTAVRTQDLANPAEWDLVDRDGRVIDDVAEHPAQGEAGSSEWRKRFGENPLRSTRQSECDPYTWSLLVLAQDMMTALERAAPPAPRAPSDQPEWVAYLEKSLNRRATIEAELYDMAAGKRPLPDRDRCRAMANELGVPEEFKSRINYTPSPPMPSVPDDTAMLNWLINHSALLVHSRKDGESCRVFIDDSPITDWHSDPANAIRAAMVATGHEAKHPSQFDEKGRLPEVPSVPDGMRLVPVRMTDDMAIAFAEAWFAKKRPIDDPEFDDAYEALLVAAPQVNS